MGKGLYLDVKDDRMQGFNLTQSNEFGVSKYPGTLKPHPTPKGPILFSGR